MAGGDWEWWPLTNVSAPDRDGCKNPSGENKNVAGPNKYK